MKISNQVVSFAAALLVASPFANADTKILSGNDSIIRELKSKVSAVARFGRRLEDVQDLYDTTIDGLENLDDQISMQDLQDFLDEVDTSQMDDSVANLFGGMAELLGDEDFVQCVTDQQDLLSNNPELQAAEDSMNANVDDSMENMDVNISGGKIKMDIDIPQDDLEAGKNACIAAGANFQTYSKFNCEGSIMGIDMSMKIKNMAQCMPDTDACAGMSQGEMVTSIYETMGLECDVRVSGGAGRSWATASYLAGIVAVASAVFGI